MLTQHLVLSMACCSPERNSQSLVCSLEFGVILMKQRDRDYTCCWSTCINTKLTRTKVNVLSQWGLVSLIPEEKMNHNKAESQRKFIYNQNSQFQPRSTKHLPKFLEFLHLKLDTMRVDGQNNWPHMDLRIFLRDHLLRLGDQQTFLRDVQCLKWNGGIHYFSHSLIKKIISQKFQFCKHYSQSGFLLHCHLKQIEL